MRKYLPEPFDLRSAAHVIEGSTVVVIYIDPNPSGFCIFRADGNYPGSSSPVFRAGDVFARHGSASERWRQEDIERVMSRIVSGEKERWRQELTEELQHIGVGAAAQRAAQGPASALTWRMDAESFIATVVEQLRQNDTIPLRLLIGRIPQEVISLVLREDGKDELNTLLDRLTCLAATFMYLREPGLLGDVVRAFVTAYDGGYDEQGVPRHAPLPAPRLWLMVIERIFALGGLAVRTENWGAVRDLALQRGGGVDFDRYTNWLRHALTMAARSGLFTERETGRDVELSLISLALRHVEGEECLRPDLPAGDERLLNSICQFDILASLAAIADAGSARSSVLYTSFARWYSQRTEPAVARLLEDPVMRELIFPLSDDDLAAALRAIDRLARSEAFRFAGWDGFIDGRIQSFLEAHQSETE
jgi:hypothetical protein